MEIGNEISQKIRSAIKAKLIELGAYVDDELPDYIMVMVANKKTQKQMSNDLSLFLSHNTDTFTAWLHNLLKKLQSINSGQESSSSKHKSKDKHKVEKRKHRSSQSEKSGKSVEPEKKKAAVEKAAAKPTDTEAQKDVASEKTVQQKAAPPTDEETGTEINISENTDEFNEENKEVEKVSETAKSSSTGKPPPAKVLRSKKSSDEAPSNSKTPARQHSSGKSGETAAAVEKPVASSEGRKKPSSMVVAVKRKYEDLGEEEEVEEYDPTNPAVGSVASVIRGPARKSSVPKSLQANRSLLMKAVTEAEKSVTTAKKTDHQEKDEPKMQSDRKPVDLSRRLKTAAGLQLISRSKRKELENMTYTVKNTTTKEPGSRRHSGGDAAEKLQFTVNNESSRTAKVSPKQKKNPLGAPSRVAASALRDISKQTAQSAGVMTEAGSAEDESGQEEEEEQYGPPLPDTRLVHHYKRVSERLQYKDSPESGRSESSQDNVTDPEIQRILDESLNLTEEAEFLAEEEDPKRIIKSRPAQKTVDPKFIVTLDGIDPTTYSVIPDVRESLIQTVKPEIRAEVTKPQRPMVAVEPEPSVPSKIHPPKIKPFNISLKDTDDEEETEEQMEVDGQQTSVLQERCRFWPACANGNACQYVHPSIPCKTFPYCKFGDKCLYIHPNCKFDAKCTRPDCPFTHSGKRLAYAPAVIHKVVQVPMQSFMPTIIPRPAGVNPTAGNMCKFFPNCKNMNCPFIHPKPCRYGISCMNKANCMFQHPALPDKDKLSWSASIKKDSTKQSTSKDQPKSVESTK